MSTDPRQLRFRECIDEQKSRIQDVEKIIRVNAYLKQFNWAYVHPYVMMGYVEWFEKMSEEGTGDASAIFRVFARSFYDLKATATFTEGLFKQRPSLAPFGLLIDQAVVLALQQEYAGAINLLIPVIEGSMRHYLVSVKGKSQAQVTKAEDLLKVFFHLEQAYVARVRQGFEADMDAQRYNLPQFDDNQLEQLVANERVYIGKWLSIVKDYLAHNLYLDTRTGAVADKLNRHVILHGFSTDIYYSFENFLRLYHLLFFLSWAYTMATPNTSLLVVIDDATVHKKWGALEKIRLLAKVSGEAKATIYAAHPDFDQEAFQQPPPTSDVSQVIDSLPAFFLEQRLRFVDESVQRACNLEQITPTSRTRRVVGFLLGQLLRIKSRL